MYMCGTPTGRVILAVCVLVRAAVATAALPGDGVAAAELERASELRRAGVVLYRDGRFQESLDLYNQALALAPQKPESHAYVATACYKLEQLECAEEGYRRAIALGQELGNAPTMSIPYRSNLGGVLHKAKRFDHAIDVFQEALALVPGDRSLQMNLEATLIDQKKWFMECEILATHENGSSPFWDIPNLLNGKNYSEKAEVIFKEVVEQRALELLPPAVALLRQARAAEPAFAISAHLLADIAVRVADLPPAAPDAEAATVLAGVDTVALRHEAEKELLATLVLPESAPLAAQAAVDVDANARAPFGQLHVVAVATELKDELKLLYSSALALGHRMAILGLGAPWRGLGSKVDLLSGFLENKPADDVVLFIDAYDVLLLSDSADILSRFETYGASLVFSAEVSCAPDAGLKLLYNSTAPASPGPFAFANSGSYMGRVSDVKAMLDEVVLDIATHHTVQGADPFRLDDQRWFNRFYLRQNARRRDQRRIVLDHAGLMFHTLHGIPVEAFSATPGATGSLRSNVTSSKPCLVHGNGEGISTYRSIASFLMQRGWPSQAVMDAAADDLAVIEQGAFGVAL